MDKNTQRLDAMSELEAKALAQRIFGPRALASMTRHDVRIYLYRDCIHMRLIAKGKRWSTVFARAIASTGVRL